MARHWPGHTPSEGAWGGVSLPLQLLGLLEPRGWWAASHPPWPRTSHGLSLCACLCPKPSFLPDEFISSYVAKTLLPSEVTFSGSEWAGLWGTPSGPLHRASPQSATQSAAPSILMLSRLMGGAGTTGSCVSEKLNLRVWCDFTAQSSPFLLLPCLVRALGNRPSGVRSPIKASPLCPAFAWHPRLFLRAACLAHPLDLVPPPGPHCSLTTLHPVLPGSLLLLPSCFFCLVPFPILPYLRHVVLG